MRNKKSLITIILLCAAIFACVVSLIVPKYNSSEKNGLIRSFNEGWYIKDDNNNKIVFDDFGKTIDDKYIEIYHAHDDNLNAIDTLGFYNYYSAVEIYVGEKMIYNYGSIDDIESGKLLGNYYSMVDIHRHEMETSEIKVVFISNEPQTIYGFDGGTGGALGKIMIREHIIALFAPILTILYLIISAIVETKFITKELIRENHNWLIIFAITISLWELFDTQIFMNIGLSAGVVCLLSFETYMLIPIPLLMFIYYACSKYRNLDITICFITIINFVVLNILNFTKVVSFVNSLTSTHLIVFITLVLCLLQVTSEKPTESNRRSAILLTIGYVCFMVSAVVQYLSFFVDPTSSNSTFLQIGVLIFLVLQISDDLIDIYQKLNIVVSKLETQTRFLRSRFTSFVPDKQISRLENEVNIMSGKNEYLTVLESDIRGFSEITQNMSAEDAIDMLNHYLECMTNVLRRFNAIVLEFVGDAIIAIFNEEKHADKAVIAAVEMQYLMTEINKWNKQKNYPEFEIGIGINTGNCYVGYIGSESRMEYSAIGSTINLVSRIETYSTGGQILISKECKNNITVNAEIVNSFNILPKGFKEQIEVFLISGLGQPYNIRCGTNEEKLVVLNKPVNITFNLVENKHTSNSIHHGVIHEASKTNAMIDTNYQLKLFDNLRINYNGIFSCKVISKSERGVLVRFTSVPTGFDGWE